MTSHIEPTHEGRASFAAVRPGAFSPPGKRQQRQEGERKREERRESRQNKNKWKTKKQTREINKRETRKQRRETKKEKRKKPSMRSKRQREVAIYKTTWPGVAGETFHQDHRADPMCVRTHPRARPSLNNLVLFAPSGTVESATPSICPTLVDCLLSTFQQLGLKSAVPGPLPLPRASLGIPAPRLAVSRRISTTSSSRDFSTGRVRSAIRPGQADVPRKTGGPARASSLEARARGLDQRPPLVPKEAGVRP